MLIKDNEENLFKLQTVSFRLSLLPSFTFILLITSKEVIKSFFPAFLSFTAFPVNSLMLPAVIGVETEVKDKIYFMLLPFIYHDSVISPSYDNRSLISLRPLFLMTF
jgi:hypothetical protein